MVVVATGTGVSRAGFVGELFPGDVTPGEQHAPEDKSRPKRIRYEIGRILLIIDSDDYFYADVFHLLV
jgi:hypothetical protein